MTTKLRILLIGSGGRESAVAIAVNKEIQQPNSIIEDFFAIPSNPQIAKLAKSFNISTDNESVKNFCLQNKINLVIVGPEDPLAKGIVDYLESFGIKVFGPSKAAARLESSKIFMKNFCAKYKIPTAQYQTFTSNDDVALILQYADSLGYPVVLKTDGLAAGKGVVICQSKQDFTNNLKEYLDGKFGLSSKSIVVEEFLTGTEVSFFALSDGIDFKTFFYACDHKRLLDGDKGPNTGGMGTYSFKNILTKEQITQTEQSIIAPLVKGMTEEGCPYKGVIFAGLMLTAKGIKLIEYNVRFGDPETQAMLPLLKNNITDIFLASVNNNIKNLELEFSDDVCVNVVCVSGGYPDDYKKGCEITGHQTLSSDVEFIHCGTKLDGDKLVTNGGRVASVRVTSSNMQIAKSKVYPEMAKLKFDGLFYRKDICDKF